MATASDNDRGRERIALCPSATVNDATIVNNLRSSLEPLEARIRILSFYFYSGGVGGGVLLATRISCF